MEKLPVIAKDKKESLIQLA